MSDTGTYAWCPICYRNNFGCEHNKENPWRSQADGFYEDSNKNQTKENK